MRERVADCPVCEEEERMLSGTGYFESVPLPAGRRMAVTDSLYQMGFFTGAGLVAVAAILLSRAGVL